MLYCFAYFLHRPRTIVVQHVALHAVMNYHRSKPVSVFLENQQINISITILIILLSTSIWLESTMCVHPCTLTFHQLHYPMFNPVASWWLWPATKCVPPGPAHRAQHSEHSTLGTPGIVKREWTTVIIIVIVTWMQHHERPYQYHLQHLYWQMTHLPQQNITTYFTWHSNSKCSLSDLIRLDLHFWTHCTQE